MLRLGYIAFAVKLFVRRSRDTLASARESWCGRTESMWVHCLQVLSKTTWRRRRYLPNYKIMSILKPALQGVDGRLEKLKPRISRRKNVCFK